MIVIFASAAGNNTAWSLPGCSPRNVPAFQRFTVRGVAVMPPSLPMRLLYGNSLHEGNHQAGGN